MYYVFLALFFMLPAVIAASWYVRNKRKKRMLSGRLFGFLEIKIVGPLAIYFLVLSLNALFLYPDVIGIFNLDIGSDWSYELTAYKTQASINSHGELELSEQPDLTIKENGTFRVNKEGGDVLRIANQTYKQNNRLIALGDYGLLDHDAVYIPLLSTQVLDPKGSEPTILAYGASSKQHMILQLYSLQDGASDPHLVFYGDLLLTRIWPIWLLLLVTLMPLFILVPMKEFVDLTVKMFPKSSMSFSRKLLKYFKNTHFEVAGVIVVYFIIYILLMLFVKGDVLLTSIEKSTVAYRSCIMLQGDWYHNLYSYNKNIDDYQLSYVGKLKIKCDTNMSNMSIDGFSNSVKFPYKSVFSCYRKKQLGGESWHISLVGIKDANQLFGVYQVDTLAPNIGLITADLNASTREYTMYFYDFRNYLQSPQKKNNGQLTLFDADSESRFSCAQLSLGQLEKE